MKWRLGAVEAKAPSSWKRHAGIFRKPKLRSPQNARPKSSGPVSAQMIRPREQSITQAPAFPEWQVLALLSRHHLGCTRFEIIRFSSLEPERIAAALKRLQTSGMVTSETYARGELFYIIA
jgi:hypothetical protein